MAKNLGQKQQQLPGGAPFGGVTSMSTHGQRFQQMRSPGSQQRRSQFLPEPQSNQQQQLVRVMAIASDQNRATMSAGVSTHFAMKKQMSHVRQDDAVQLRPNTAFNPMGKQNTGSYHQHQHQHTYSTASRPKEVPRLTMASSYVLNQKNSQIDLAVKAGMAQQEEQAADQHDCTNEEQIDEFEMVDQEEIFDECDEQTSLHRHQMNLCLSRHPLKNSSPSDVFNVFNRGVSASTIADRHASGVYQQARVIAPSCAKNLSRVNQTSAKTEGTGARSCYGGGTAGADLLARSPSPSSKDRSRQGSLSPPPEFAHLHKEAFFGSSFAANGSSGKPANYAAVCRGTIIRNNYALSSVRMQESNSAFRARVAGQAQQFQEAKAQKNGHANNQGQVPSIQDSASLAIAGQDQGPQNFKHIEMISHQIPDQFRADLENVGQDLDGSSALETSLRQDEDDTETFELSHSLLPNSGGVSQTVHTQQHLGNENQFLSTDQDTIIDQDDDVAEESSAVEQFQDHFICDPGLPQATQQHDGPVYRFIRGANREEDIQDEDTAQEEELETRHASGYQRLQVEAPSNNMRQKSPAASALHTHYRKKSNPSLIQSYKGAVGAPSQAHFSQASHSSMTFSQRGGPLTNKPLAAMIVPKHHQSHSSMSRHSSHTTWKPNPSVAQAARQPEPNSELRQGVCETVEDIQEPELFGSDRSNPIVGGADRDQPDASALSSEKSQNELSLARRATLTKRDNKESKAPTSAEVSSTEHQGKFVKQAANVQTRKQTEIGFQHLNDIQYQQQDSAVHQSHFSVFSAANKQTGFPMIPGQETFRSPQGSPSQRLNPRITGQAAQQSNEQVQSKSAHPDAHQTFQKDAQNHLTAGLSVARRDDLRRQTANFYSSEQRLPVDVEYAASSSRTGQEPANGAKSFFGATQKPMEDLAMKSNTELQKEFLDVQRQLKQMQKTQAAALAKESSHKGQKKAFDDVQSMHSQSVKAAYSRKNNNSSMLSKQQPTTSKHARHQNSSITDLTATPKEAAIGANDRRNTSQKKSQSRPAPKPSSGTQTVSKRSTAQMGTLQSLIDAAGNNGLSTEQNSTAGQLNRSYGGTSAAGAYHNRPASSATHNHLSGSNQQYNVRQMRMSARPLGPVRSMDSDQLSQGAHYPVVSPTEHKKGLRQQRLSHRRSPLPAKTSKFAANDVNETMSAKNFSLAKNERTRLRNARTFVDEEQQNQQNKNLSRRFEETKNPHRGMHVHNRSVLSGGDAIAKSTANDQGDILAQSLVLPGRKQRPKGQLQALADLRQRENNTVQTGQIILARQRSREAYLDKRSTGNGLLKSSHDRMNRSSVHQATEVGLATDRPSLRYQNSSYNQCHRRGHSRQESETRGGLFTHSRAAFNHMTEQESGDHLDHGVGRNSHLRSTTQQPDPRSEALDGEPGDEDEGYEDILSRSQSLQGDDEDEANPSSLSHDSLAGGGPHNQRESVDYKYGRYDSEQEPYGAEYGDQERLSDDYDDEIDHASEQEYDAEYFGQQEGFESQNENSYQVRPQPRSQYRVNQSRPKVPQAYLNYSASSEDASSHNVYTKGVKVHDSQRREKVVLERQRQRSPMGADLVHAEHKQSLKLPTQPDPQTKVHRANQKHLRQQIQGGTKSQIHANTSQRQLLQSNAKAKQGGTSQSTHDFQVDKNMRAHFNVTHKTRKRNQPLKININMTGGSSQNNSKQVMRQDTSQSVSSMQNAQAMGGALHYQLQQHQQQMMAQPSAGFLYAQSQPTLQNAAQRAPHAPLFYPQVPTAVDTSHQLQQLMLQQQNQQLLEQIAATKSQQIPAQPHPAETVETENTQELLSHQVLNEGQGQNSNGSSRGHFTIANAEATSKVSGINTQGYPLAESKRDAACSQKQQQRQDSESAEASVSWLHSEKDAGLRKQNRLTELSPQAMPAEEAEEQDAMEELWKKLREHELSSQSARQSLSGPPQLKSASATHQDIQAVSSQKVATNIKGEDGQGEPEGQHQEEQLENFVVTKRKKKAQAIIIGFENREAQDEAQVMSPFQNKPVLGANRYNKKVPVESVTKDPQSKPDPVVPLGSDFKKVSIEQIQAREERLKRIKDQGLIEIAADAPPLSTPAEAPINLADAFAAKRKARMGRETQLDQDLAVARDASANARPAMKVDKVAKTPKELFEIRKAMMKRKPAATVEEQPTATLEKVSLAAMSEPTTVKSLQNQKKKARPSLSSQRPIATNSQKLSKEPSAALMERLAGGKRQQIDKKEMKKLTKSNYENLPEIKRRKEEERRRQEALEKKERIAKYNKECKARSRAQLKKKRDQAATAGAPSHPDAPPSTGLTKK